MELDAITAAEPAEPESAHTSSRKSARSPRIELITRGERRRRWTVEQKQTIAAQSLAPGASPTEVAHCLRSGANVAGWSSCFGMTGRACACSANGWSIGTSSGLTETGRVSLTPAQLSMLLEGIDWRMPVRVRRPELAG
jgi:Transposase